MHCSRRAAGQRAAFNGPLAGVAARANWRTYLRAATARRRSTSTSKQRLSANICARLLPAKSICAFVAIQPSIERRWTVFLRWNAFCRVFIISILRTGLHERKRFSTATGNRLCGPRAPVTAMRCVFSSNARIIVTRFASPFLANVVAVWFAERTRVHVCARWCGVNQPYAMQSIECIVLKDVLHCPYAGLLSMCCHLLFMFSMSNLLWCKSQLWEVCSEQTNR